MIFALLLAMQDAPSASPPRRGEATPLSPATPPQNWVTNDDYPEEAIRQEMSGVVGMTLDIGTDGLVKKCTIIESSGHALLDEASCALLSARASFNPARDRRGRAIVAQWKGRFRWDLPDRGRTVEGISSFPAYRSVTRFVVDETGVQQCRAVRGDMFVFEGLCDLYRAQGADWYAPLIRGGEGPVRVFSETVNDVEGIRTPEDPGPREGFRRFYWVSVDYEVDATRAITRCAVADASPGFELEGACEDQLPFGPGRKAWVPGPYKARHTLAWWSDGPEPVGWRPPKAPQ